MSDKWSFTVRRTKIYSPLTIRWTYPWTESPMIHFFTKCFGYPSASSSPRLPDSHANHAVWPMGARLLLFPSCWSPWLRRFAHERGHVRRRKDGTGLFLSSSVTRGGLKSLAHGLTRRKGENRPVHRQDTTQCRYHGFVSFPQLLYTRTVRSWVVRAEASLNSTKLLGLAENSV